MTGFRFEPGRNSTAHVNKILNISKRVGYQVFKSAIENADADDVDIGLLE